MTEPMIVRPEAVLQQVRTGASVKRVAEVMQRLVDPGGTPYGKVRLGYVQAFDPATWTCTALVSDLLTPIPNIAVLGDHYPPVESPGIFLQTGGQGTTEYILIGTLPKDPGTSTYGQMFRVRKTADEDRTNSGTLTADTQLKFYGQAGRTYLCDIMLIVCQNSINNMDIDIGWILPSGTTWSGGGPGPISTIAPGTSLESSGAGANWRAGFSTSGALPYGVEVSGTNGVFGPALGIHFHSSIKMGATSGICSVAWNQHTALTATTRVREGSYLRADMTAEYTL